MGFEAARDGHEFSLALNVNGSGGFYFTPVGKRTTAQVTSPWPDPSFRGSILPAEREIGADGFEAAWRIPHLARAYPQALDGATRRARRARRPCLQRRRPAVRAGRLLPHLGARDQIRHPCHRADLLAFFLFEYTLGVRLSVIQYALVGGALAMFFLLLISLAEHIGFLNAYLAARRGRVGRGDSLRRRRAPPALPRAR